MDAVGEARLPAVVLLQPRGHYDLADLPAARSAELGPLSQRVERAVLAVDGVARVHVNRWGDGGAHLHFWLPARPAGPRAHRRITAAPAAEGGTA
jgi:diadenosine tetraphosphate (Ap4A) HIT family hydrolase